MITVYRLKSDNFDCFVSEQAYSVIRLQMSSGDFGSHKARPIELTSDQLENLKWHSGKYFVDVRIEEGPSRALWDFYDGKGDCNIETEFY